MNTNHLSLIPDMPEEESFVRLEPQKAESGHITLSDIAERLRLLHDQMKRKTDVGSVEDVTPFPLHGEPDLKGYLDDLARALLAEYEARRTSQNQLVEHFDRLEELLLKTTKEKSLASDSERKILVKETAEQVVARLKPEFVEQTNRIISEYQKENQEISRQLRENVSTSRFSAQLLSLQKQITNIEASLGKYEQNSENYSSRNTEQSVKTMPQNKPASLTDLPLSDKQENQTVRTFDKPVIRRLADGKTGETVAERRQYSPELQRQNADSLPKKNVEKLPNNKISQNTSKISAQTAASVPDERASAQLAKKPVAKLKRKKLFGPAMGLFLMAQLMGRSHNIK